MKPQLERHDQRWSVTASDDRLRLVFAGSCVPSAYPPEGQQISDTPRRTPCVRSLPRHTVPGVTTALDPEPAPPLHATRVFPWDPDHDGDGLFRYFIGTKRGRDVCVEITGCQEFNGTASRRAWVRQGGLTGEEVGLGPDELRALAAHCLGAADELEALA